MKGKPERHDLSHALKARRMLAAQVWAVRKSTRSLEPIKVSPEMEAIGREVFNWKFRK